MSVLNSGAAGFFVAQVACFGHLVASSFVVKMGGVPKALDSLLAQLVKVPFWSKIADSAFYISF